MQPFLESRGLKSYEEFVTTRLGEVVAQSSTSLTRRLTLDDADPRQTYYLKIYRHSGRRMRSTLRRDKASIEAANYHFLQDHCDVLVPRVICHGSRRLLWSVRDAFILTQAVPGAIALDACVAHLWPDPWAPANDPLRQGLLEQCADLVRRMHDAGFYHIDLQWRNLLVTISPAGAARLYVIDSSRGGPRRWSLFREHGRLRDLSSLAKDAVRHLTRVEQLRWFKRYLDIRKLSAEHRQIIRTIARDRQSKDNAQRP